MKLPKGVQRRGDSYVAYCTRDGKAIRKVIGVVGCVGRAELVRLRSDLEKEIRDGLYPPVSKPEPAPEPNAVLITDLWHAYLADCTNRDKRVDRLKTAWTHLESIFGKRAAAIIKTKDIEAYITVRRDEKRLNGTINRELAVLKALMRHAARSGEIERVPMFPRRLKESKPRGNFIDEKQYILLRSHARELWLRTFLALGFNFGFRKGELLSLRVRNADLLEGWLSIDTSKNGDSRKVKLTQETLALLAECVRGKKPDDFILTRQDGSRVAQPRKGWYDLCCRAGLGQMLVEKRPDGKTSTHYEGLQMHDLRRSAARRLLRSGVSEKVCMTIAGWRTRSIFDRYNLSNDRDLEQAAKLIEVGRQVPVSDEENRHKTDTRSFAHS
jgi:integrase